MRTLLTPAAPLTHRHIQNYSSEAGQGSQTFAASDALRRTLLGTVAAGALFFGYGRSARAGPGPCSPPGGATVTCTGDQSDGITNQGATPDFTSPPTTTLNVNSLTADIAPTTGSGIEFVSPGNINIDSDTTDGPGGPFAIITTADNGAGIYALSALGSATILHTGDITTSGLFAYGIYAGALNSVDVTQYGSVTTSGDYAHGVLAYSYLGAATVTHTGDVTTGGYNALGIIADGNTAANVTQIGDITTSGDFADAIYAFSYAGTADVYQHGNITTHGDAAYGIHAAGAGDTTVTQIGNITTSGDIAIGVYAFSYAGAVEVSQTGDITTIGGAAYGILAAGFTGATVTQIGDIITSGDVADGIHAYAYTGPASVTQTGNITTSGNEAYGIYVNGSDTITVTHTGDITTSGELADGISVWSYGNAPTTVTQTGDITVTGDGSDAIDVNQYGNGTSLVTINAGSMIVGGPGSGDGVDFDGDGYNHLVNYGTITTLGENAIEADDTSDETIDNHGTVTGNVDLGGGTNTFNNMVGALFNAGSTVALGTGNLLYNAGTLNPGGSGVVQTTTLTGNLQQTSDGTLAVDVDGTTSDMVTVSGTANLAGMVAPNLIDLSATDYLILNSGATTDSGLSVDDTLTVDYELAFAPDQEVHLLINAVNFAVSGLNQNQTNIANHLNDVFAAGIGGLGPVLAGLGNLQTLSQLANALDQLSPEIYGDTQLSALYASLNFSSSLLGCKINGADTAAINRENECLWVSAKVRFLDNDQTFENIGFNETAGLFTAGTQLALDPLWRLSFGFSYQNSRLETATHAHSDGDMLQGGVALKYNPGALMLAGIVSGGRAWYDTTRPMSFSTFSQTAEGDHTVDILSGRLHASYVLGTPSLYFKPMIDAAVNRLDLGDFAETGAGGANLVVNSHETTIFNVSPALELGTEWWLANGTLVRPFLRTGVTWFSDGDVNLVASFAGTPGGVSPFTIRSQIDQVQADLAAGLEVINSEDSVLRLTYDGQIGETTQIHSFAFRGSVRF